MCSHLCQHQNYTSITLITHGIAGYTQTLDPFWDNRPGKTQPTGKLKTHITTLQQHVTVLNHITISIKKYDTLCRVRVGQKNATGKHLTGHKVGGSSQSRQMDKVTIIRAEHHNVQAEHYHSHL